MHNSFNHACFTTIVLQHQLLHQHTESHCLSSHASTFLVHFNKECEVLINLDLQECIRTIILEPLNSDLILDQPIVASTPEVTITQIHSP